MSHTLGGGSYNFPWLFVQLENEIFFKIEGGTTTLDERTQLYNKENIYISWEWDKLWQKRKK